MGLGLGIEKSTTKRFDEWFAGWFLGKFYWEFQGGGHVAVLKHRWGGQGSN